MLPRRILPFYILEGGTAEHTATLYISIWCGMLELVRHSTMAQVLWRSSPHALGALRNEKTHRDHVENEHGDVSRVWIEGMRPHGNTVANFMSLSEAWGRQDSEDY